MDVSAVVAHLIWLLDVKLLPDKPWEQVYDPRPDYGDPLPKLRIAYLEAAKTMTDGSEKTRVLARLNAAILLTLFDIFEEQDERSRIEAQAALKKLRA